MSENCQSQNLINEDKIEFDKWAEDLKELLSSDLYHKDMLFIISFYWFNKYIKSIIDSNIEDKKLLEIKGDLKDDNNELFVQFTQENINIEDFPKIFVLNKNIWMKIKNQNNELNTIASIGYFYNNFLFIKILSKIYCFYFLDKKNEIRQGYLQINNMEIEIIL